MHNQSTKLLTVGGVALGGGSGVKIQSMTTTKTAEVDKTVSQILALERAGCEIVRVAIADEMDAVAVKSVKERINIPLVADIHFSPKLAVMAIENGADKVRINPGNIGGEKEIKFVAECVKAHGIPVRVGSTCNCFYVRNLRKMCIDEGKGIVMKYFDKTGVEIKAGMILLMSDGTTELIYDTTDSDGNPDLGINASNEDFLRNHPGADREYYSLGNYDLSSATVL